jgi:hypothetical protein
VGQTIVRGRANRTRILTENRSPRAVAAKGAVSEISASNRWYSATLLLVSEIGGVPNLRPLCERRFVMLTGETEQHALSRLIRYGHKAGHSYRNQRGELVRWSFCRVERIEECDAPNSNLISEAGSLFQRVSLRTLRKTGPQAGL